MTSHRTIASPRTAHRPRGRRGAFTLIELVVVIVIIGIAASAVVPRLVRDDSKRAEASARAVRDVVSSAATRTELTGRRVALTYDARSHAVKVMEFRWAGLPTDWEAGGVWQEDMLIPPASLEDAEITAVRADAFSADPRSWTIEFAPGTRRPALSILVAQPNTPRSWRVDLASGSMRAEVSRSDAPGAGESVIDLDRTGASETAW